MNYEKAREILNYDENTGRFAWRIKRGRSKKVGDFAGTLHKQTGYIIIEIEGKKYKAHRLVFLVTEGYMPEYQVDHINGDRTDNRRINLRHVSRMCNLQNQKIYRNNRSGVPGVGWHNNKPRARVRLGTKLIDLGHHPSILEAALARHTWEQNCPNWQCNSRSELTEAIKRMWPEFQINKIRSNENAHL